MALPIILLTISLLVLAMRHKKRSALPRTQEQKQDDELITIILPTIHNDN